MISTNIDIADWLINGHIRMDKHLLSFTGTHAGHTKTNGGDPISKNKS